MNNTLEEILDQLNNLTAQVKEIIEEKSNDVNYIFTDEVDGTSERVSYNKETETCTVEANKGYCYDVNKLCELKNTGNGFIAYFPSYNSAEQDNYICMDYSEADYLLKALLYLEKQK